MDNYTNRFNNNESIETTATSMPNFPGRMVMYNNNTGVLSLIVPGQNMQTAQEVQSLKFATDFTMTRLKYRQGQDVSENSNYVIEGDHNPFVLNVMNKTYTAKNKREMVQKMQLQSGESISQEVIYIGYIVSIDGEPSQSAEPVRYVSRGINAYRLNDEIQAIGGLKMQTMIHLIANKEPYKNNNGGTNLVLTFDVNNLDKDKAQGFLSWVTKDGSTQLVDDYKRSLISMTKETNESDQSAEQPDTEIPFGRGQEVDIDDDDLPF